MYKEYRDVTRTSAVTTCCKLSFVEILLSIRLLDQDMASRHRARFRSIQIIRVAEVKSADVRRPYINQLLEPGLKFPLPHRVIRVPSRRYKPLYLGQRPNTFF